MARGVAIEAGVPIPQSSLVTFFQRKKQEEQTCAKTLRSVCVTAWAVTPQFYVWG
jgi:hypothetical protein